MITRRTTVVLFATLVTVFAARCAEIQSAEPAVAADTAKPASRSALLTDKELLKVLPQVLPGCARVALVAKKTCEVLVGFAKDGDKPVALAAVARLANKKRKGSMVVVIGLKGDGKKEAITHVVTLPAKGKLAGSAKYEKGRAKFLKQFDGRVVKTKLGKVNAVSGATSLCKGIKGVLKGTLKVMRAMKAKPDELAKLAAKSWPATPPAPKKPAK